MSDKKTKAPKSIKGTQTEINLATAYMAESQAYARYTYYATQADKEEYFPIGEVFRETAANELRHGKVYFKFLEGGKVDMPMNVDAGIIGTTAENLKISISEEEFEGVDFYLAAAKTARKEGFNDIADHFEAIAKIENTHKERFQKYLEQVENGTVWKRDKPITWKCLVCGYEHVGTTPPEECPACDHPYQHYMAMDM
ncbi:MAG: rubrerythrin family protein [Muribaculaceae bacterium]|nr:rubrerythrin family protein [Muribaculaceae bacterium]MDE6541995.1 rubrerythrin family protein [Muribaculaceae bacterium]